MEDTPQDVDENYIKYSEIHPTFRQLPYRSRLAWWRENGIIPLTVVFYPDLKIAPEYRGTLRNAHKALEDGRNIKTLSIEPFSAEQFEEFEQWAIEKSMQTGRFTDDCLSDRLIRNYWIQISLTPLPKELLEGKIKEFEAKISEYEFKRHETAGKLFFHSYERRKQGLFPIDYNLLYYQVFNANNRDFAAEEFTEPENVFPDLYRGWAYCEYKGFLEQQKERLLKGEDISKPDQATKKMEQDESTVSIDNSAETFIELKAKGYKRHNWLGSQKQLAELFIELKEKGWIDEINAAAIQSCFTKSNTIGQVIKPGYSKGVPNYDGVYSPQYKITFDMLPENQHTNK